VPEVPVTTIVPVPAGALLAAVMVSMLVPVVLGGLKDAVIPVRRPLIVKFTELLKLLIPVTVIVVLALEPWMMVRRGIEAAIEKSGGGGTVTATVVVWTRLPEVPVIVRVPEPIAAQLTAFNVSTLPVVVVAGLNDAVTPEGRPLTLRFTAPLKPLRSAIATVVLPLVLRGMVRLVGVPDNEKSGVMTVRAIVAVWVKLPEVPVMVRAAGPTVAMLDAVRVKRLVLVVLEGLKDAVTPPGSPLTARFTAPLNPLRSITATVLPPLPPWPTLTDEAESA
jgi:hypothetical protein